jgi:hypothetical protein
MASALDGFFLSFRALIEDFTSQIQKAIKKDHNTNTSRVVAINSMSVLKLFPGVFLINHIEGIVNITEITIIIPIYNPIHAFLLFIRLLMPNCNICALFWVSI